MTPGSEEQFEPTEAQVTLALERAAGWVAAASVENDRNGVRIDIHVTALQAMASVVEGELTPQQEDILFLRCAMLGDPDAIIEVMYWAGHIDWKPAIMEVLNHIVRRSAPVAEPVKPGLWRILDGYLSAVMKKPPEPHLVITVTDPEAGSGDTPIPVRFQHHVPAAVLTITDQAWLLVKEEVISPEQAGALTIWLVNGMHEKIRALLSSRVPLVTDGEDDSYALDARDLCVVAMYLDMLLVPDGWWTVPRADQHGAPSVRRTPADRVPNRFVAGLRTMWSDLGVKITVKDLKETHAMACLAPGRAWVPFRLPAVSDEADAIRALCERDAVRACLHASEQTAKLPDPSRSRTGRQANGSNGNSSSAGVSQALE